MSRTTLRIITIIWYIVVALGAIPLIGFILMMLFGFAWSGYTSGSEHDNLYLVAAAVPVALVVYVSYWLHKKNRALSERDMRTKIESERVQQSVVISPESSVLQALSGVATLSLQELSARIGIDEPTLVKILDSMVRSGTIERHSSVDGISFSLRR